MATVNNKTENEGTADKDLSSSSSSSSSSEENPVKPNYFSSMSFVNLVETMFVKKEDCKPIDKIESVAINVEDELLDTAPSTEEIPFLSIEPEVNVNF